MIVTSFRRMSPKILNFLLTYDIECGVARVEAFGEDKDRALVAYQDAEHAARDDSNIEVILLGSDSEDTIRHTHSSYFDMADSHVNRLVEAALVEAGLC